MEETKALNIDQRINAVMAEIDYIKKDKKIELGKGSYTVTGHDSVTKLIHPLLVKHGINLIPSLVDMIQDGNRTRIEIDFAWRNVDDKSDCIIQKWFSYGIDPQDKGPGKAISYAQRFAVLKTLHIETGDADLEDDLLDHEPEVKPEVVDKDKVAAVPPAPVVKERNEMFSTVSEKQGKMIYAIMMGAGFDSAHISEYLQNEFNVKRCSDIPRDSFKNLFEDLKAGNITPADVVMSDIPF